MLWKKRSRERSHASMSAGLSQSNGDTREAREESARRLWIGELPVRPRVIVRGLPSPGYDFVAGQGPLSVWSASSSRTRVLSIRPLPMAQKGLAQGTLCGLAPGDRRR